MAERLGSFAVAAKDMDYRWPHRVLQLCDSLAQRVSDPAEWIDALLSTEAPGHYALPFLRRIAAERSTDWEGILLRCFEDQKTAGPVLEIVLANEAAPRLLMEEALEVSARYPEVVETTCLRGESSETTLRSLLEHGDAEVATAAAVGAWAAEPRGALSGELLEPWRRAILRAKIKTFSGPIQTSSREVWLLEILRSDPGLAADWIAARPEAHDFPGHFAEGTFFGIVFEALRREDRLRLLHEKATEWPPGLLGALVGGDIEVYRTLLTMEELRDRYFEPLHGVPDEVWMSMAEVALNANFAPETIAEMAFGGGHICASGGDYWTKWRDGFASFEGDSRPGVQAIARHGRKRAEACIEEARQRARADLVRGIG